jgi:hypothetical protein
MLPAHQSFETGDASALQRNNGLVMQAHLVALDCVAQVGFSLQANQRLTMHFGIEHLVTCFAATFSAIHRGVGVAQDVFDIAVAGIAERHANAGSRKRFVVNAARSRQKEGLAKCFLYSFCDVCSVAEAANAVQ